jgi:hypothetical protein
MKNEFGVAKYPELSSLYKKTVVISQSQADVERGFSLSKNLLTSRQTSMNLTTFKNKKYVIDGLKLHYNDLARIIFTDEVLMNARKSRKLAADAQASKQVKVI